MTTIDFTPLFRSTVGFDRLMNLLESSMQWSEGSNGYPPYNIEKTGDDRYRVTLAIAGFSEDELAVEVRDNILQVEGRRKESENGHAYLFRSIAGRSFKRQFQLADFVRVAGANLHNGLLTVDLVREVPETMKPRRIAIGTSAPGAVSTDNARLIEGESRTA